MERKRLADVNKQPDPVPIVHGEGTLTKNGYQCENHNWLPFLTTKVAGKRVGLDPRRIKPEVLTASGHPPKSATTRIKHYLRDLQIDRNPKVDKGLKQLRKFCLACAESPNDVRDCACIDCPLWCHRLGLNPHNYHAKRSR